MNRCAKGAFHLYKKSAEQGGQLIAQATALLLGGIISVAVSVLLLLLGATLMSNGMLNENKQLQLVLVMCLMGTFLGGMYAGKRWGRRRLFAGVLSGAAAYLVLLAAGLIGYGSAPDGRAGIGILVCCICGGGIAGFVRSTAKKKQKRRSR